MTVQKLLQEICKDEINTIKQARIQELIQLVGKVMENYQTGNLIKNIEFKQNSETKKDQTQKRMTKIETNMSNISKKMDQLLEIVSKKNPTYAEVAAKDFPLKNLPIPQVIITKKPPIRTDENSKKSMDENQKKATNEIQNKSSYKERRLIIRTSKEFIENLNSMKIRDQINDAFQKSENIIEPVVAMITKSQTNQSIVVTTMPKYTAKWLLEKKKYGIQLFQINQRTQTKNGPN